MTIGPYTIIAWPPASVRAERTDDGATITVEIREPQFWFERNAYHGLYRWRMLVGWLDVRHEASYAQYVAHRDAQP